MADSGGSFHTVSAFERAREARMASLRISTDDPSAREDGKPFNSSGCARIKREWNLFCEENDITPAMAAQAWQACTGQPQTDQQVVRALRMLGHNHVSDLFQQMRMKPDLFFDALEKAAGVSPLDRRDQLDHALNLLFLPTPGVTFTQKDAQRNPSFSGQVSDDPALHLLNEWKHFTHRYQLSVEDARACISIAVGEEKNPSFVQNGTYNLKNKRHLSPFFLDMKDHADAFFTAVETHKGVSISPEERKTLTDALDNARATLSSHQR